MYKEKWNDDKNWQKRKMVHMEFHQLCIHLLVSTKLSFILFQLVSSKPLYNWIVWPHTHTHTCIQSTKIAGAKMLEYTAMRWATHQSSWWIHSIQLNGYSHFLFSCNIEIFIRWIFIVNICFFLLEDLLWYMENKCSLVGIERNSLTVMIEIENAAFTALVKWHCAYNGFGW